MTPLKIDPWKREKNYGHLNNEFFRFQPIVFENVAFLERNAQTSVICGGLKIRHLMEFSLTPGWLKVALEV